MKTPARMEYIKSLDTDLSAEEKKLAILEGRRLQQIRELGDRYLLAPAKAPMRGTYNPYTGARLQ